MKLLVSTHVCCSSSSFHYAFVVVRLGQLDAHEDVDSYKLAQIPVHVDDNIFPPAYSTCCANNSHSMACVHEWCYRYNKNHNGFILFPNGEKILLHLLVWMVQGDE
jgi:hypothetical protein